MSTCIYKASRNGVKPDIIGRRVNIKIGVKRVWATCECLRTLAITRDARLLFIDSVLSSYKKDNAKFKRHAAKKVRKKIEREMRKVIKNVKLIKRIHQKLWKG